MHPVYDCDIYGLKTLTQLVDNAPPHHNPFDRTMLVQAEVDELRFITHDSLISYYSDNLVTKQ